MNTVLEVRPHQCLVQGQDYFPSPAHHTIPDTSQDAIGLLGHLGMLLAHIQLTVHQYAKVPFHQAAFHPFFPKPVGFPEVVVTKMQDLTLGPIKTHTINLGPSIQSIQVHLYCLSALRQINIPSQLDVICKFTEGAHNHLIKIINKDVK